jgi:hypothetical protein
MDKGEQTGAGLRCYVATEGSKVIGSSISDGHAGRRALVSDELISWDSDGRPIRINVRMQVNETRGYEFARFIEQAVRALRRNIILKGLDPAEANANVPLCTKRLAGVDELPAFDHQIELVARIHSALCLNGGAGCGSQSEGAGASQEVTT